MKKLTKVLTIATLTMAISVPSFAATPNGSIKNSARHFFRDTLRGIAKEKENYFEHLAEDFADNIEDIVENFADLF
jgi:hypothetical protein